MRCLTREKGGCPTEKWPPEHHYTKSGTCKRCGGHAKDRRGKEIKIEDQR
jgi:hypothetical protein